MDRRRPAGHAPAAAGAPGLLTGTRTARRSALAILRIVSARGRPAESRTVRTDPDARRRRPLWCSPGSERLEAQGGRGGWDDVALVGREVEISTSTIRRLSGPYTAWIGACLPSCAAPEAKLCVSALSCWSRVGGG